MSLKKCVAVWAVTAAVMGVSGLNADVVDVNVQDGSFSETPVVIQPGDTVRWTWIGNFGHSTTAAVGFSEFWDSGVQTNGSTFEHEFTNAGTYPYYCQPHGDDDGDGTVSGMSALVIVQGDGVTINGLAPAISGQKSTLWANGATPNNKVYFVYGLKAGSTNVPGCGNIKVDIARPKIIGSPRADADGVAQITVPIPASASGLTVLTQAIDLNGCLASNVVEQTIQ